MKIVIYFSALFGLFWLIHGVLSHHDPVTKRNSIKHANVNKDRGESQTVQDKVLIRSESPLRGRKIHQTAWSEEETDGENGQVTKPNQKESTGLESSWTLEKVLKYLTSLVYPTEDTDQPGHILITSELIRDGSEAKSKRKNKQKSTKKNHDESSKNTQKNGRREHSTHKLGYFEDYYENFQTETDISDEIDESDEISYEYENEDESRTDYKRNSKIFSNNKPNHRFQDKNGKTFIKADQTSSLEDDEDCSEDIDVNLKQNSGEIDIFLKKVTSKNNDMKHSSEEINFKQETIANKKYKDIKSMLRSKIENGGLQAKKRGPKIIVLNGTKFTGQNNKNKENDDSLQTSIQRKKSKVELSNTENTVSENISEDTTINEQQKNRTDSYVNEEMIQQTNKIIQNTSVNQTEDVITDTITELSALNNSDNIEENTKTSSVMRSKPNKQKESKSTFVENKQTGSKNDEYIKNEVQKIENMQNEEMLIATNNTDNIEEITKTSFIMESKPNKEIENKNSFIETKQSVSRTDKNIKNEVLKTENVQNEETLIATSIDNTTKQSLVEKNTNLLETPPEILTYATKQENIQTNNEETVNNPVRVQTILIKTELKNGENNEFGIQNRTEKISDTQIGGNYEEETENFDKFSQHQASQIFVIENNQQNYETKNLNDQIKETRLISKDDNGYEYVLEGNEFVPLNSNNEEQGYSKTVGNNYASENKTQLLTESIVQILENVNQAENEQQETFETILEFLYKHSKNPLILSLKENSSATY